MADDRGSGQLFYKVALDKREDVDDGFGNTVGQWVEQFQCRAAYHHLRGSESVIASRLQGKHIQAVKVRANSKTKLVTSDWRLRDLITGTSFNVREAVANIDRQFIDLLVESGVADG